MTTLELTEHPELAALVATVRRGEAVEVMDHGQPVMRCIAPTSGLADRLAELHQGFSSPAYAGNSVVDMRRESR